MKENNKQVFLCVLLIFAGLLACAMRIEHAGWVLVAGVLLCLV